MSGGAPMNRGGVGDSLGVGDRGAPLNDEDTGRSGEGFPVPTAEDAGGTRGGRGSELDRAGREGDEAGDEGNLAQDDATTPFLPEDHAGRPTRSTDI